MSDFIQEKIDRFSNKNEEEVITEALDEIATTQLHDPLGMRIPTAQQHIRDVLEKVYAWGLHDGAGNPYC